MDLAKFCAKLRSKPRGTVPEDMQYLQSIVGAATIQYEVLSPGTHDTMNGPFSHLHGAQIGRIIITAQREQLGDRRALSCHQPFHGDLNGLILDFSTWRVLAVPLPVLNFGVKKPLLARNMSQYLIYEARDGTVVNIYWHGDAGVDGDGCWCIGTANGIDIHSRIWMGTKTFAQALREALAGYRLSFDTMNKNLCYNIGFSHPEYHPLQKAAAWAIRTVDLAAINARIPARVTYSDLEVGLPIQRPIKSSLTGANMVDYLFARNVEAKSKYIETKGQVAHFGWILRGPPELMEYASILLESSLLRTIRGAVYDCWKEPLARDIAPADKFIYAQLRAYLSYDKRDIFRALFPQCEPNFERFADDIGIITKVALNAPCDRATPAHKNIASAISQDVKQLKLDASGTRPGAVSNAEILRDVLTAPKYLHMYMTLYCSQKKV